MSDEMEKIYDEAPTEPEVTETPADVPSEENKEVIEELAEGSTPEAKESETPEVTEEELAEAALKKTEPPPEKETVPLPKYMAEKTARREAEDRATRAEGAVEALQKLAEPKPMSIADMIKMGRIEPEDAVPAEIWAEIETNKAEAAQNAKTSEPKTGREAFLERAQNSEEKMIAETANAGEALTFAKVVEAGKHNLSAKDQAEIVRAEEPSRKLYELCIERTPELRSAAKKTSVVEDTKDKKDTKVATKTKEPKNAPIPKGTAEQQSSADAEVDFMEAEMAKDDDQQLEEIRELTKKAG